MELVRSVTGGGAFYYADHLRTLSEERRDGKKYRDAAYESKLKGLASDLRGTKKRLLLRAKGKGAWLSVQGTKFSGTVLFATESWDFLFAHYNVSPLNLQSHCDRYGTAFRVTHTLSCSICGLVIARHNEICHIFLYLS